MTVVCACDLSGRRYWWGYARKEGLGAGEGHTEPCGSRGKRRIKYGEGCRENRRCRWHRSRNRDSCRALPPRHGHPGRYPHRTSRGSPRGRLPLRRPREVVLPPRGPFTVPSPKREPGTRRPLCRPSTDITPQERRAVHWARSRLTKHLTRHPTYSFPARRRVIQPFRAEDLVTAENQSIAWRNSSSVSVSSSTCSPLISAE